VDQYLDTLNDKESKVLDQYDALRAIWGDILQGFSYMPSKKIYVKHLDDLDHCSIAKLQTSLALEFLNKGVPTRKERLDFIMNESKEWSQDDEDEISSAEYFIIDNESAWKESALPAQKQMIGEQLDKARETIRTKKQELESKLGAVAETKAEKLANSYYIYHAFHKDQDCTERLWESMEEFDEIEDFELTDHIYDYNRALAPFSAKNIQKLAVMPFTLNLASYCKDNGLFFFGKPITQFTNFQLSAFTKINRNTFVLRESKTDGAPEITNNLTMRELVEWYDHEYAVIVAENKIQAAKARTRHF